jgi:Skp family chaperone for outer membrane proteins
VKKSLSWAVLAAVLSLCVCCSISVAQGPAGAGGIQPMGGPPMAAQSAIPPTRTAVLDVPYIFKNHVRFKMMMEDLKRQVQQAEEQFKAERQQVTKMAEELQQYNKGTDKYKELEEKITDLQTRLTISVNRQKTAFLQQEARNYYTVYQEICQATDYFCQQYGIDLVIKFNREKINPDNPDSVLSGINQLVVHHRGLDISDQILANLNRDAPANAGAADRRGTTPPRPASPFGAAPR